MTGEVRLRLEAGRCDAVGRRAPRGLYDHDLATYDAEDAFRHAGLRRLRAALGPVGARRGRAAKARDRVSERTSEAGEATGQPLWHGRFGEGPADELLAFTVSLPFDRRLAADDLAGSRAHVHMLERVGLLDRARSAA